MDDSMDDSKDDDGDDDPAPSPTNNDQPCDSNNFDNEGGDCDVNVDTVDGGTVFRWLSIEGISALLDGFLTRRLDDEEGCDSEFAV